jgi:hypothetical protein
MNIDRAVMIVAGVIILLSVALTHFVSIHFVWLTVFAGANMIQSAFTGFCPPAILFRKLGMKSGCAFQAKSEK